MDIKEIKTEFITSEVPEHFKHKPILLDLINKMPSNPDNQVSKTDWNLPKDFERKYLDYFYFNIAHNWFVFSFLIFTISSHVLMSRVKRYVACVDPSAVGLSGCVVLENQLIRL